MQSDDVIWEIINKQHCSFKIKAVGASTFCRNEYNLTGMCTRRSCPLANARYATVREHNGIVYLYMKTAERSHLPSKMWERIKLSKDYLKALQQIDTNLIYWPDFMVNKCKERLTKITQYLIKMDKLKTKDVAQMTAINKKTEAREATRESKALTAARLEKSLERELIARLKARQYGDAPLNVNEEVWQAVLNKESQIKSAAELELESDEESDFDSQVEFISGDEFDSDGDSFSEAASSGEEEESSDEEVSSSDGDSDKRPGDKRPAKKQKPSNSKRARPRINIEYEQETERPGVLLN